MRIIQDFIPKGRKNRPANALTPRYITVHNTANTSRGANAEMHARYVKNPTTAASWHFTVDDGSTIYQHLPTNENGWHAGDGHGAGNRQSIGIEICENSDGNHAQAMRNAAWLIRKLMKEHNIPISNVVPHRHWSGKNCPRNILPIWSQFIGMIKESDVKPASNPKEAEKLEEIKKINQRLDKIEKMLEFDAKKPSEWAADDWKEACENGYLDGSDPRRFVRREELAKVVNTIRRNFLPLIKGKNKAE